MSDTRISLEQWSVLVAVVESGGYAQAAARLHKSQSTLTYAIQKLESLLGVAVFERQGRRAVLTARGELLYRRGKQLVADAAHLEHVAHDLASGWEAEIRLAADIIFPTWLLLEGFARFAEERPDTHIELYETVLGGTDEALTSQSVQLAIGTSVPQGFAGDVLMPMRAACMAAPSHPLHLLERELSLADLKAHRHIVIRDSGEQRVRSAGWLNELRWTVTNKATSIRAVCMGLGYAWFPEDSVRNELVEGVLKPLPLREGAEKAGTIYIIFADRDAAGPGTQRIAEILRDVVRSACRLVESGSLPGASAAADMSTVS